MIGAGVFGDREPFELIHGWIVQKMGINPPHTFAVTALHEFFLRLGGPHTTARSQQPITTADSEPEPDAVLAAGSRADYAKRHPFPSEVLVLVEVSGATLNYDQTTKKELYAKANIEVYWIVNLVHGRVEVYTEPSDGQPPTYRRQTNYGLGEEVPVLIRGVDVGPIPVRELIYQGSSDEHQDR